MKYLLIVCAVLLCGQAFAQSWDALSDAQREVLKDYESGWDELPQERQNRLALGATRWLDMGAEQRGRRIANTDLHHPANDDDSADRIGHTHQRSMKCRCHVPNHLPSNDASEDENGEIVDKTTIPSQPDTH